MNLEKQIMNNEYDNYLTYPNWDLKKTDPDRWRALRTQWDQEEVRLDKKFRDDSRQWFEEQLKTQLSDRAWDKIFWKAWDDGHASGLYEVYLKLDDILEIVKVVLEK